MNVLLDTRYRCACCGEPMMRDGGNRHQGSQKESIWMCLGQQPTVCPRFGLRLIIPIVYVDVPLA